MYFASAVLRQVFQRKLEELKRSRRDSGRCGVVLRGVMDERVR